MATSLQSPLVPPRLTARVRQVLTAPAAAAGMPGPEALLGGGDVLLQRVLVPSDGAPRAVALDLLAADACVTWAFEVATGAPAEVVGLADAAMRRIAEQGR